MIVVGVLKFSKCYFLGVVVLVDFSGNVVMVGYCNDGWIVVLADVSVADVIWKIFFLFLSCVVS